MMMDAENLPLCCFFSGEEERDGGVRARRRVVELRALMGVSAVVDGVVWYLFSWFVLILYGPGAGPSLCISIAY